MSLLHRAAPALAFSSETALRPPPNRHRPGGNAADGCFVLGADRGEPAMKPDRATAELEKFLAVRGEALLRTATLLAGEAGSGEDLLLYATGPDGRPVFGERITSVRGKPVTTTVIY